MIFSMKVNINVFCKLVVSLLQVKARHTKSTQNSKFVTSLQYLRKKGGSEVDFLHTYKHQTILQFCTINLCGHGQACPSYPK